MRLTDKKLRDSGWEKHPEGIGWVKDGAFYSERVSAVSQFTETDDTLPRVILEVDKNLPAQVKLHLINAVAAARRVAEGGAL